MHGRHKGRRHRQNESLVPTTVTLPRSQVDAADGLASRLARSRSYIVREALKLFFHERDSSELRRRKITKLAPHRLVESGDNAS